jgi:hypothetical protein
MIKEFHWKVKRINKKRGLTYGNTIIWLVSETQLEARPLKALLKLKDFLISAKIHADCWYGNDVHVTATPEAIRAADWLKHALKRVIAKKRDQLV